MTTIDLLAFNNAAVKAGVKAVGDPRSFASMADSVADLLPGVLAGAARDEAAARAWLVRFARAARLVDVVLRLGFAGASWASAFHVLSAHGVEQVRGTATGALSGNAEARASLRDWFDAAAQTSEAPWMAAVRIVGRVIVNGASSQRGDSRPRPLSPTGSARLVTKGQPRRPTHRTEPRPRAVALKSTGQRLPALQPTEPVLVHSDANAPGPTFVGMHIAGRPIVEIRDCAGRGSMPMRCTTTASLLLAAMAVGLVDEVVLRDESGTELAATRLPVGTSGITLGSGDPRSQDLTAIISGAAWNAAAAVAIGQACQALSVVPDALTAVLAPLVAAHCAMGAVTAAAPVDQPAARPKRNHSARRRRAANTG